MIDMAKKLPVLYHKGKNGAIHQWTVWSEGNTIYTEHGQVDGKMQIASKVAAAKNVGRANATTAEEQAIKEAVAMHKFKLDRKYSLTPDKAQEELLLPMLAHSYFKRKPSQIEWPMYVQPKYDGFRCMAEHNGEEVILYSRSGKIFDLPHISNELLRTMTPGSIVDGELYFHDTSFQTISSWIKREQPERQRIEYHLYDMPANGINESATFHERYNQLVDFFNNNLDLDERIKLCPTSEVNNEEELLEQHQKWAGELGFEGVMGRHHKGLYLFGYRSYDLLKVKDFDDDEFPIVGHTNGIGKFETCVIWICKMPDGKEFKAVPKGTFGEREEYLRTAEQYYGKLLTVTYQGFTDKGVPRFSVGKGFRPEEDLP